LLASCFESNPAHRPVDAAALAEQLSGLSAQSAPALPPIPAANQPPPRPQPARSSPEPIPVPPVITAEKPVLQAGVVARPEVHERSPVAEEARRQGDAAPQPASAPPGLAEAKRLVKKPAIALLGAGIVGLVVSVGAILGSFYEAVNGPFLPYASGKS